ncbi:unnamed protein product [Linum trigynum]|uniref:Uncharacterized protein n=1 Tax=Linum trigynum TaxID=586398 RepID=A0AAV2CSA6_9ROSI
MLSTSDGGIPSATAALCPSGRPLDTTLPLAPFNPSVTLTGAGSTPPSSSAPMDSSTTTSNIPLSYANVVSDGKNQGSTPPLST